MRTHVFLLRHAESADPKVFHGAESDIDLSERGRRQATAIADVLARHKPDVVVSSAMRRARQTAEAIVQTADASHVIEPRLHERKVGILSGKPFATDGIWPETIRRWKAGDTAYAHEGAESLDDLRRRVVPAWQDVIQQHQGRTFVVVAHGIVCRVILLNLFPTFVWDSIGSTRNVALTELVLDGDGWRLLRLDEYPPELIAQGLC